MLLAGSLIAYAATRQSWRLVPLTILLPDLLAVGYLIGARAGAHMYNAAHSTAPPAAVVARGWWQNKPLVATLGLIWIAHIGIDRLLDYSLKYDGHFQHTHLGHLGQPGGTR